MNSARHRYIILIIFDMACLDFWWVHMAGDGIDGSGMAMGDGTPAAT